MLKLTLFLTLSLFACSNAQDRIVNGIVTEITSSPYLVALYLNGNYYCAGTIVSEYHIVTAAHCVQGRNPAQIEAVVGISTLQEQGQRHVPDKIWYPSVYTIATMNMDVAVIKVKKPFIFSDKVAKIPLCSKPLAMDMPVRLGGWGKINELSNVASNELRTVSVPVVSRNTCAASYARSGVNLTPSMVCAGRGERDACSGDSGGPGVIDQELCGVVSFGMGCARADYPGVYTNVNNPQVRKFLEDCMRL